MALLNPTKKIPFTKMSGSGNDFIIIDNREKIVPEKNVKDFVVKICQRGVSVGADGVIFIEPSEKAHFQWHYFNSDGGEVEMCGNGSRCVARYAYLQGIGPESLKFETLAGIIRAEVKGKQVKVQLPDPKDLSLHFSVSLQNKDWKASFINTGVPHTVYFVDDPKTIDIEALGRETRFHSRFQPMGTNVNFVKFEDPHHMKIRTYERGVEGETLACGTGAAASALISGALGRSTSPVSLTTQSGEVLKIFFNWDGKKFSEVFLEGDARIIYSGEMGEEAWE